MDMNDLHKRLLRQAPEGDPAGFRPKSGANSSRKSGKPNREGGFLLRGWCVEFGENCAVPVIQHDQTE